MGRPERATDGARPGRRAAVRASLALSPTERFCLTRSESAAFLGQTLLAFDDMVRNGEVPPARRIGNVERWIRTELERAALDMPETSAPKARSPYENVGVQR